MLELAGSPSLHERLARHALNAARARSWESALAELAAGYARALGPAEALTEEGGPGLRTEGAQPPALRRAA